MPVGGITLLLFVVLIVLFVLTFFQRKEGFVSIAQAIENRSNALADGTNPTENKLAKIGISAAEAEQDKGVMSQAFPGMDLLGRYDTDESYLGRVKFCMDRGAQPNPFDDPTFREFCGMCMTSGTILPKTTSNTLKKNFTTPTGVLIYPSDKKVALEDQTLKRLPFPRVIPSLDSAVCTGASMSEGSQPVLAISKQDYEVYKKRSDCVQKGSVDGTGCGSCLTNKKISFVDRNARRQPLSLLLFGEGDVVVELAGKPLGESQPLSMSKPVVIPLGMPSEGTLLRVNVLKGKTMNGPYVHGVLKGTNPNDTPYDIDLYDTIEVNVDTKARPAAGIPKVLLGSSLNLTRMNGALNATRLLLDGRIPVTFTEYGNLASFDCPNGPFVTSEASAEMFVRDPCLRPKGQGPLTWSDECIRSKLVENKMASGTWYQNPQEALAYWKKENNTSNIKTNGDFFKSFSGWLQGLAVRVEVDIDIAKGAIGKDLTTPCDPFLKTDITPNKECMTYLYKNQGTKNKRIGPTYGGDIDASDSGLYNPQLQEGQTAATNAALAPGQGSRYDKVKRFYKDEMECALNTARSLNTDKAKGGRKDCYANMLGVSVLASTPQKVSFSSNGTLTQQDTQVSLPANMQEVVGLTLGRENEMINVVPNTKVRYGTLDRFVTRLVSGQFRATNGFFGSDPAPGVLKRVYRVLRRLGSENQTFNVPPNTLVYYGTTPDGLTSKQISGVFTANNALFGDPARGVQKGVFVD